MKVELMYALSPRLLTCAIPQKFKQGSWGYTFLNKPLEFLGLLLYPWKYQTKNKALPLQIRENSVIIFESFEAKNQYSWKSHMIFAWSSLLFLKKPLPGTGNITYYFFNTPENSKFPSHSPYFFLSPLGDILVVKYQDIFLRFDTD